MDRADHQGVLALPGGSNNMQSNELDTLARLAYTAYGSATGYRNFRGEPMPEFDDLGASIQNTWRTATQAVAARVAVRIAELATEWIDENPSR